MYSSIAPWYDRIFPPDSQAIARLAAELPPGGVFLDIGCATGALATGLAQTGLSGSGIDLDTAMIAAAQTRARAAQCDKAQFSVVDMTRLDQTFAANTFDLVICFGNTLVHLADPQAITACCRQIRRVLRPTGRFIGQIIGYDRILTHGIAGLPTIEQLGIRFERSYLPEANSPRLLFATRLTVEETGQVISNQIPLYPLRKDELVDCLTEAGFTDIQIGQSPDLTPWDQNAYAVWFAAGPGNE